MKGRAPWATLSILLANFVVAYFALGNQDFLLRWGFTPKSESISAFERLLTSFTSLFVHIDPFHLLANMLFLAAAGPAIEKAAGWWRFLLIYLLGGVLGVWSHGAIAIVALPGIVTDPISGASAAIAALVGYAWLRFGRVRVPLLPKLYVSLYVPILIWALLQVAGGIWTVKQFGAQTGYWAHLGGFLSGFLLALILKAGVEAESESWTKQMDEADTRSSAAKSATAKSALKNKNRSAEAFKALFESSEAMGDAKAAEDALEGLLLSEPAFENGFAAIELSKRNALHRIPAAHRLRIATEVSGEASEAAERLLESVLQDAEGPETPKALFALVEIAAASDPAAAKHYAQRLSREYSLSPQTETARARWPELFS